MKLNDWLSNDIQTVANSLVDVHKEYFSIEKTIGFEGQEKVYKILTNFRNALFPCLCEKRSTFDGKINISIGNKLRASALDLRDLLEKVFANGEQVQSSEEKPDVDQIVIDLINKFPEIRRTIQTDIQAAYNGDPATTSTEEILFSYPSIIAITIHRIAHELYKSGVPIIPRIMSEYAHSQTGIDIHPGATIGDYFFIDHGTGVVIGETCTIGKNVKIYQGVTLGAKSFPLDEHGNPIKGIKRHPDIEDNVVIYAGATILGGDTKIGHDSVIGGNIWLTESVPPFSRVYQQQPTPKIKNDQ
ncbi:serine O-acetyltransferase OS=Ureibacillus acetophenoni OX=614649 GN=SAMN05877842_113109 PE=3 SV=1 [Ureibacillus acetophenoni]|uniref:serine O-acetyltransferase EpsC n=1 Tax=Ureibacillus sp. MALMAid1270 TaxID=3411629 RepID=UPI003BA804BC